jgi:hypothetical protein
MRKMRSSSVASPGADRYVKTVAIATTPTMIAAM